MVTGLLLILLGMLVLLEPRIVVMMAGGGLVFLGAAVVAMNLWLRRVQRWEQPTSRGWKRFFVRF